MSRFFIHEWRTTLDPKAKKDCHSIRVERCGKRTCWIQLISAAVLLAKAQYSSSVEFPLDSPLIDLHYSMQWVQYRQQCRPDQHLVYPSCILWFVLTAAKWNFVGELRNWQAWLTKRNVRFCKVLKISTNQTSVQSGVFEQLTLFSKEMRYIVEDE